MSVVGGAVFLGMSWTWLIGMVLPVYLTRDFGWAGWLVFAVPNVLGAMAVGFVFRSRAQSEGFEARHAGAMRWFSIYTVVFHAAVLGRLLGALAGMIPLPERFEGAVAGLMLLVFASLALKIAGRGGGGEGGAVRAAVGALVVSVVMFVLVVVFGGGFGGAIRWAGARGTHGLGDLSLAAPAIVLGFLACPHLDLTIHRVRRRVREDRGRAAFALGFGVFFLGMILFTLGYAGGFMGGAVGWLAFVFLCVHFGVQSAFTCGVHLREIGERAGRGGWGGRLGRWWVGVLALGVACSALPGVDAVLAAQGVWSPGGSSWSRVVYEVLISAYALVFPAYLWTRVVVGEWMGLLSARWSAWVWWVSAVVASPGFAVGYVGQVYVWLAVGVGVLLVLPVLVGVAGKRKKGSGIRDQAAEG